MAKDLLPDLPAFAYETLAVEAASAARADADWIKDRWRRLQGEAVEGMIAIGLRLIEARECVGHGNFLPWIAAEFDFDRTTAVKMMQAADRFGSNVERIQHLPQRSVYLLAAASTPDAVRDEILSRPPEAVPPFLELKEMVRSAKAAVAAERPAKQKPLTDQDARRLKRAQKHEAEYRARRVKDKAAAEHLVSLLCGALGERFEDVAEVLATINTVDLREALAPHRKGGSPKPQTFDAIPDPAPVSSARH